MTHEGVDVERALPANKHWWTRTTVVYAVEDGKKGVGRTSEAPLTRAGYEILLDYEPSGTVSRTPLKPDDLINAVELLRVPGISVRLRGSLIPSRT